MSPGFEMSESDAIFDGLPFRTIISSEFVAKRVGASLSNFASETFVMFASSAEASTSIGAPSMICCARVDDAPKLTVTFTPRFAFSNAVFISVKAPCNEEAAETVSDPDTEVSDAVDDVVEEPHAMVLTERSTRIEKPKILRARCRLVGDLVVTAAW